MTDSANPTPGQRVDAAIEEARQTVQDIRTEVEDLVTQFGDQAIAKVSNLVRQLDQKLDEIGAAIDGSRLP